MCNKINNIQCLKTVYLLFIIFMHILFSSITHEKNILDLRLLKEKNNIFFFDNAKADDQAHIYYLGSL